MTRLRVAVTAERAESIDGWGRYTVELVRALGEEGVEPILLTQAAPIDSALRGLEHHVVMPGLFGRRFSLLRHRWSVPAIRQVLDSCHVVHNVVEPFLPVVVASKGRRQPLVQSAHGTWAVHPFTTRVRRTFHVRALRKVSLLVCQSRYTQRRVAEVVTLPPNIVLPAGVRSDDFTPVSGQTGQALRTDEARIALMVSPLKARKGIHVALEAIAAARRHIPSLQLVVVGRCEQSAYARQLADQVASLRLNDAVHFAGEVDVDGLREWYRRADVFLFPSVNDHASFEGLGLVCLEASASGIPVVASRECGAEEAVLDGVTGILVAQRDPVSLADALVSIVTNAEMRARMSDAAVCHAAHLSWQRLAQRLVIEYRRLVS